MTSSIFHGVEGIDGRINTVVHHPPLECSTAPQSQQFEDKKTFQGHVIFFPGDIQGFREEMTKHHICVDFIERSYENTIELIAKKFPLSHIWLVVPFKKAHGIMSVYKNFVPSESLLGIPSIDTSFNGFLNLEKLLENAVSKLDDSSNFDVKNCPISLIAFSKGSVVLNQFLYEISSSENQTNPTFLDRIKSIFWLDGGHSGEELVWVTDDDVISNLNPLKDCKFFVHVTPYQVKDEHRPWKGKAKKKFVKLMKQNGMIVADQLYFEDLEPSIILHFKVLEEF